MQVQGTTLERIVDPELGIVFGLAWGTDIDDFLKEQPKAVVTRDEADVQVWTLQGDIHFCGIPIDLHFVFRLDALIGIDMRFELEMFDAAHVEALVGAVRAWFDEDLMSPEEGVLEVEQTTTKLTLDLLDKQMTLQDLEP